MYKALYRKYRPEKFTDVIGQEHITTTLQNQIQNGSFSHAYLFTGSRGTGKTTCAKILARGINCLSLRDGNPCGECKNCKAILLDSNPDVIEMDAASNRGVDCIRELRDRIAFAPATAKYKVYIIDEVHMLTTEASNALLKTLEEPPAHAVFILATTEVHKILPTILSRCQRYDFKRIEPQCIADRLKFVANSEGLELDDEAALLIANIADGGMRDALSILDLASGAASIIDEALVCRVCGRASAQYIFSLADSIFENDTAAALYTTAKLHEESVDMARLCSEMASFFRTLTLIRAGVDAKTASGTTEDGAKRYSEYAGQVSIEKAMYCLKVFGEALSQMTTADRRETFEMAIIRLTTPNLDTSSDALLSRIAELERKLASGNFTVAQPTANTSPKNAAPKDLMYASGVKGEVAPPTPKPQDAKETGDFKPLGEWYDIINACKKRAPLIAGMLVDSTATISGDKIIVHANTAVAKRFLAKRDSIEYRGLLEAIEEVLGKVAYPQAEKEEETSASDPLLSFAERLSNIDNKN